jgi:hypothetical protein
MSDERKNKLKEFCIEMNYEGWTPLQYVDYIRKTYLMAKLLGIDRLSMEWSKWSSHLNRNINAILKEFKEGDERRIPFVYVSIYWVLKSQLLSLHRKNKILNRRKINKLKYDSKKIRRFILYNKISVHDLEEIKKGMYKDII